MGWSEDVSGFGMREPDMTSILCLGWFGICQGFAPISHTK